MSIVQHSAQILQMIHILKSEHELYWAQTVVLNDGVYDI